MVKVNRELLPVKAHYFFFFAALGPLLPQLNVYGRQLGVSPQVMGLVTAVLPLLWGVAKPCFGYLVDYFTNQRKLIFMLLIAVMSGSYCSLWFLPQPTDAPSTHAVLETVHHLNGSVYLRRIQNTSNSIAQNIRSEDDIIVKLDESVFISDTNGFNDTSSRNSSLDLNENLEKTAGKILRKHLCHWNCGAKNVFKIWLGNEEYITEMYIDEAVNSDTCGNFAMEFVQLSDVAECRATNKCDLLCIRESVEKDSDDNGILNKPKSYTNLKTDYSLLTNYNNESESTLENEAMNNMTIENRLSMYSELLNLNKSKENETNVMDNATTIEDGIGIYGTITFWGFVILMCVGTVAFNVANCIGDAVCFDVLGAERASDYGSQRAFGTAGYGATAFLGGWLVDVASAGGAWKDFTPAFVLAAAFTLLDLLACRRLRLPRLSGPGGAEGRGALRAVLRCPRVLVFIMFAVIAGMFDSFIIYYMFWYIEELAEASGTTDSVKLLEGVIVFVQSFGGELLFFFLSGGILKRYGHGTTMTVCLLCYGVRMAFVSLITNPWYLVPFEAVMQGPTYALCYATIVGYAAAVAPEGHSATMQGIVAGMDDGLGFALGSLLGGQLYGRAGGAASFRAMAAVAAAAALLHAALQRTALARPADAQRKVQHAATDAVQPEEGDKMLTDAEKYQLANTVYCDTVVPLHPTETKATLETNNVT